MSPVATRKRLLLVDDDRSFLLLFVQAAKQQGRDELFEIITVNSAEEALQVADKNVLDVVVTDVHMPGLDGMELFNKLNERRPDLPVIILTAFGTVDKAVEALKKGAYHYFQKPLADLDLFWKVVAEAASGKIKDDELEILRRDIAKTAPESRLIGSSEPWIDIVESIKRVAPLPSTVLITGETGTGKEVAARAVHQMSRRAHRPFISISCVEFAGTLLETELFGHERGAFTGATSRRLGIFERAHGATLFLDEIAETSMDIQAKLLRVLEGSTFYRVGGQEPLRSDFRLIAATNRNMEEEVENGRFRRDLYYRLAVYPIHIPPLRERLDDIYPLAIHLLDKAAQKLGRPTKLLSGEALAYLHQHSWPGNVRELENLLERAIITTRGDEITAADIFPGQVRPEEGAGGLNLEKMERILITAAMDRCRNNKTHASALLGISRKTLAERMIRLGLQTKK